MSYTATIYLLKAFSKTVLGARVQDSVHAAESFKF